MGAWQVEQTQGAIHHALIHGSMYVLHVIAVL
jgi:hypothetical protein